MSAVESSGSTSSDEGAQVYINTVQAVVNVIASSSSQIPPSIQRREYVRRDRHTAHDNLVCDYFANNPKYGIKKFRRRYHMNPPFFSCLVKACEYTNEYFRQRCDTAGVLGFSSLQKCSSAIRQLAYGSCTDSLDEYFQMSERTSRESLLNFCNVIVNVFGKRYLRKPSWSDTQRILQVHEEQHGLPGMLGSLDCMHWEWELCPNARKGQHQRGDHPRLSLMLEAVASCDTWIWHAFFGVAGLNNDLNDLNQSPIFDDLIDGRAPTSSFFIEDTEYKYGYWLVDGIFPEYAVFVKPFTHATVVLDPKRTRYNNAQTGARKYVERAFGVLKKRLGIVHNPSRFLEKYRIRNVMYACIILHNMILEDEGRAVCQHYVADIEHPYVDIGQQAKIQNRHAIFSRHTHNLLQADLVEKIWLDSHNYEA